MGMLFPAVPLVKSFNKAEGEESTFFSRCSPDISKIPDRKGNPGLQISNIKVELKILFLKEFGYT